jgi:hypothetical protein
MFEAFPAGKAGFVVSTNKDGPMVDLQAQRDWSSERVSVRREKAQNSSGRA